MTFDEAVDRRNADHGWRVLRLMEGSLDHVGASLATEELVLDEPTARNHRLRKILRVLANSDAPGGRVVLPAGVLMSLDTCDGAPVHVRGDAPGLELLLRFVTGGVVDVDEKTPAEAPRSFPPRAIA